MLSTEQAIELFAEKFHKAYGDDAKLDCGEDIVTVFDNCIMIVSMGQEHDISVKIIGGEPLIINESLNIFNEK